MRTAALCIVLAGLVAGCFGPGPDERDPGPLSVTATAFRLVEDEYHAEWALEFRNQGVLPITRLEGSAVHGSLYDGASFVIDGLSYDSPSPYGLEHQKFSGAKSLAPESLQMRPSRLFSKGMALAPGGTTAISVVLYFDHINYTANETGSGWVSFESQGGTVNATDFYHLRLTAEYTYQDYDWNTMYAVSCFNRNGERITLVPPPYGTCADTSALLNREAPKWERFVSGDGRRDTSPPEGCPRDRTILIGDVYALQQPLL